VRKDLEIKVQSASTAQHGDLSKLSEELAKAKKEAQALRKQRDAKLAVHERQVPSASMSQTI